MVNTAVITFKAAHTTEACSSRSKHTTPFCEIQTAYDDQEELPTLYSMILSSVASRITPTLVCIRQTLHSQHRRFHSEV